MSRDKSIESENRSLGIGKTSIIVLMVFITIPLVFGGIFYLTNEKFKQTTNGYLSNMPGAIGSYFQSFPTDEERTLQIKEVSSYLLNIDFDRAADKLSLIKKEDEVLFSNILRSMAEINAKQTEKIAELVRSSSLKKDILISTLEQVNVEKETELISKAKYYEKLSLPTLIEEINKDLMNELVSYREMGQILENMNEKLAVKILKNLNGEVSYRLISNFKMMEKKQKMTETLGQLRDKEKSLVNIAQIYNNKTPEELANELINEKKYKIEEWSLMFRNMDTIHIAKALSKNENKDFTSNLINQIKEDEIIANGEDTLTENIVQAMKIIEEYNIKVKDVGSIYNKMDSQLIANTITKLFENHKTNQKYTLSNGESFTISDQDISIDILKNMPVKKSAEILSLIENSLSTEISKKLALPPKK